VLRHEGVDSNPSRHRPPPAPAGRSPAPRAARPAGRALSDAPCCVHCDVLRRLPPGRRRHEEAMVRRRGDRDAGVRALDRRRGRRDGRDA
jgi:hypothetical protein